MTSYSSPSAAGSAALVLSSLLLWAGLAIPSSHAAPTGLRVPGAHGASLQRCPANPDATGLDPRCDGFLLAANGTETQGAKRKDSLEADGDLPTLDDAQGLPSLGAPATSPGKVGESSSNGPGDLPSLDDSKGLPGLGAAASEGSAPNGKATSKLTGFVQQEVAYAMPAPAHFSSMALRVQLGTGGQVNDNLKWKASFRGEVDPMYAWSDFYPDPVRNDQRFYALITETYVDTSARGWDLRLGRQNVVWGEMVGLFFADVVTAKDYRQFILPSFDLIRIPQWAVRGERFLGDAHLELLWIPYASFDRIGKPGSEFYPLQGNSVPGFQTVFADDRQPARSIANSNVGARFSQLVKGWDWSAFYYKSVDSAPTFAVSSPSPGTLLYSPRHDRIWQAGGTVSKDFGDAGIFKSELVFTSGRSFNVSRLTQPNGLVQSDTVDIAAGIDLTLPRDTRLNLQVFERVFLSHDRDMLQDRFETGASVLVNSKLQSRLEVEAILIQSLNRWENLVRPRVIWKLDANLRLLAGLDFFTGPASSVFGRYRDRDRVYAELRYDF